nr:substrate-binding domain-containing protein [uncultured Holophaga sp.]
MGFRTFKSWTKALIPALCLVGAPLVRAQQPSSQAYVAEGGEALTFAMGLWGDAFAARRQGFSLEVKVAGEDKAFHDLTEGKVQMAMLARDLTPQEQEAFKARWGYRPERVALAMDALVWVVNKDNPIKRLSMSQVEAIFCAERSLGWPQEINTWGEAGVREREWSDMPVKRYARTVDSSVMGLINLFMPPSPPRLPVPFVADAMAMTEAIAANPGGICTANLSEVFASLRAVPIAPNGSDVAVEPTPDSVSSGAYPFARFLYVYINKNPKAGVEPMLRDFLAYALSDEGQQYVKSAGQAPLNKDIMGLNLLKVTGQFSMDSKTLR